MSPKTRARVAIRVQPGAKKDAITGKQAHAWKLSIRAPAIEGKANRACIDYLAELLNVKRSAITLTRGEKNRDKVFEIEGLTSEEAATRFEGAVSA